MCSQCWCDCPKPLSREWYDELAKQQATTDLHDLTRDTLEDLTEKYNALLHVMRDIALAPKGALTLKEAKAAAWKAAGIPNNPYTGKATP